MKIVLKTMKNFICSNKAHFTMFKQVAIQTFSVDLEVIMLSNQNLYFLKNLYLVFSSDLPHSKRLTSTVKKKAVFLNAFLSLPTSHLDPHTNPCSASQHHNVIFAFKGPCFLVFQASSIRPFLSHTCKARLKTVGCLVADISMQEKKT